MRSIVPAERLGGDHGPRRPRRAADPRTRRARAGRDRRDAQPRPRAARARPPRLDPLPRRRRGARARPRRDLGDPLEHATPRRSGPGRGQRARPLRTAPLRVGAGRSGRARTRAAGPRDVDSTGALLAVGFVAWIAVHDRRQHVTKGTTRVRRRRGREPARRRARRPARRRGSCRRRRTRPRAAAARAGSRPAAGSRASAAARRTPDPSRPRRAPPSPRRSARARLRARRAGARSRSSWSSTISAICSRDSGSNSTISSIRFRNSGRKCSRICSARADVRGHDQHRVAEVDRAALAVGQPPVVEHLQQHVEDLGVRLLDLVEQDDGVRAPAHRLGELAALVVADVAGRRADEARRRCAAPGTRTCRAAPSPARRRT